MAIQDLIVWYILRFWWTIPLFAVIIFLIAVDTLRRISNRVLFIRASVHGGGTMELLKTTQQGTNLEFYPQKKDKHVAHIQSDPYLWAKGFSTLRIYVVVQGAGVTTMFPYSKIENLILNSEIDIDNIFSKIEENNKLDKNELSFMKKVFEITDSALITLSTTNIDESKLSPEVKAASASISFFERFTNFIGQNLPKSKMDYAGIVIYVVGAFALGFFVGYVVSMKGIW